MIKTFYSNRIEFLFENLKKQLFSSSFPFAKRIIVVPTPAIKSWLLLKFAKDPELGVAAGLEIIYLDQALKKIQHLIDKPDSANVPTRLELTLAIERHIRDIITSWASFSPIKKNIWQPLLNYLKVSNEPFQPLTQRSEKRLVDIAETLSKLFVDYGKYGKSIIEKWEGEDLGWQQALWQTLFSQGNWHYPGQIDQPEAFAYKIPSHLVIHLFSISFLSKNEYSFYEIIANELPIYQYVISPCALFWTDLLTDKETHRLKKYWAKRGISWNQEQTLDQYLKDKNPLLANWGKLGRKMAEQLEQNESEIHSHYFLPEGLKKRELHFDFFDDNFFWEKTSRPARLLDHLHADILLLHNPEKQEKVPIYESDCSIQLHCAPTKQREIQILYNNLLDLMQKNPLLEPGEIIIMAPDIMDYAPYVHQIFGSSESLLDYQVMDLRLLSENYLIKQFWHLIDLPFGRWDSEDILYLFECPHFQFAQKFSSEDLSQIRTWLKQTSIRWGENGLHRNELLKQRHCEPLVEDTDYGTWEDGFDKLLLGLVIDDFSQGTSVNIEFNQGPLLGKWIHIVRSLRQHLKHLSDGTCKSYQEWIMDLKGLIENYLICQSQDEEIENLFEYLNEFAQAAKYIPDQEVSFVAVKKHLKNFLNRHTFVYRENHLQAIRFCSLLPMRAIPAKVIAIIGMNEQDFPRTDLYNSFNLIKDSPAADYWPSSTDYDRYLFLEALLSARENFLLSYTNYAASEGKEQVPSLLITELMAYIDQTYSIQDQKVTEKIIFRHPYLSYDASYFSMDEGLKNYQEHDYRAALSYYKAKQKPHRFLHDFKPETNVEIKAPSLTVEIAQISRAIHDPIRSYFNHALGIKLYEEKDLSQDSFSIDHLQLYHFKNSSLKQDIKHSLQEAEKRGMLPQGVFKKAAIYRIQNEVETFQKKLIKLGVNPQEIYKIQLHEKYETSIQYSSGWKIPPFTLKYKDQTINIIGVIPEVAPQGLIANIYANKSDFVKHLSEFVLLNCLIDCYQLPIEKKLLCVKSGKIKEAYFDNPTQELSKLLDYYFYSLHNLSPLTKEWLHDLMNQEPDDLQRTIDKSLNDPFKPIHNEYLKWVCRTNTPDAFNMSEHWKAQSQELFSAPFNAWINNDE